MLMTGWTLFISVQYNRRKMKKHSKFFTRHQHTIKDLLNQLTIRDIESEETRISELITKQKNTLHAVRSLKTPQQEMQKHPYLSLTKAHSFNQLRNKENEKSLAPAQPKPAPLRPLRKSGKRYFLKTNEEKEGTCLNLPGIISKRNSIQKKIPQERNLPSLQSTKLEIIQEKAELQRQLKDRSMAMTKR